MKQHIVFVSLVVPCYEQALAFYVRVLGFELLQDEDLGGGKRWIVVAPPGSTECRLLLAKAGSAEETQTIGRQAGGRVFLFLHTDDFWRDYHAYSARGVRFCEAPRTETYGVVAVFEDVFGNHWDLLQLAAPSPDALAVATPGRD